MKGIIKPFAHRKRFCILLLLMVIIYGYFAYINIPKESNPDVKIPFIFVNINYSGISPDDCQRLILRPMESALNALEGVKELKSYAYEGSGVLVIEFYAGQDTDKALTDVRNKITDHENDLPEDADKPIIMEINLSLLPVLSVILSGDIPQSTLIKTARNLKEKIEEITDVLEVEIAGDREDVVEIQVDPKNLEYYGISLNSLAEMIKANNTVIPAGNIENYGGNFSLKIASLVKIVEDLKGFPVKTHEGTTITLNDVANIIRTYKDIKSIARVNGKPAVALEVKKRTGANIISTVKQVRKVVEAEKKFWPDTLGIVYAQDQSEDIMEMISDLENGLLLAAALVLIVIIFSVGVRPAMLIALSLPASFLAGILIVDMIGLTLNVVVLFSLILTVGMIVDDAIVVSEYADRKMIDGLKPYEAFIDSATRMFWPIVTSTAVKIVVFLPLLFWPGILGQFMKYMPITVIIILTNSLLFALFFQPAIGPLFGKSKKHLDESTIKAMQAAEDGDLNNLHRVSKAYIDLLKKVLKRPILFVCALFTFLVAIYSFFFIYGTGVEFFPNIEPENASVIIRSPGDLSIYQKDAIAKEVENKILDMKDEIKIFYTKSMNFVSNVQYPQDTISVIQLQLQDWKKRRKAAVIFQDIRNKVRKIRGITIDIVAQKDGPPSTKPIEINFTSRYSEKIPPFVEKFLKAMKEMGGFKDIEDSRSIPGVEWDINVNRKQAGQYMMNVSALGSAVQLLSHGFKVSSFRPDDVDREVDIVVRYPRDYREITEIDNVKIVNREGKVIPLTNFADKIPVQKISRINRINRKNAITIKSDVQKGLLVDTKVTELKKWLEKNPNSDVRVRFKGEDEDQKEAANFLVKAFSLAFIMMFIIMLIQFNSYYHTIIVMSAVFLSTVGVLLGLIITWQPFGVVMCGIGIIALSGIVLNNNILFIDTYQHLRKEGRGIEDSILRAAAQRMRPILLTATTATLGLLPMVLGLTINFFEREVLYNAPSSQWWRQLSASIAGGLVFATLLTLFFTPCLLLIGKSLDPFGNESNKS